MGVSQRLIGRLFMEKIKTLLNDHKYPLVEIKDIALKILKWLALASAVGFLVGLVTILFQIGLVESITLLESVNIIWVLFFLPPIGLFLSGLLTGYIAPEARGHGTDAIIGAYHEQMITRLRVIFAKLVASIITIAFGGSAGREGPAIQMGGGVSSNVGKELGVSFIDRKILTLCGMSAAFASVFRSPLAGALFSCEVVFRDDIEYHGLLPASVSSIIGFITIRSMFPERLIFVTIPEYAFEPIHIIYFLVLGVCCGLVGFLYTKTLYFLDELFLKWDRPEYMRTVVGGCLTSLIALSLAIISILFNFNFSEGFRVYGLGWNTINLLIETPLYFPILFLLFLLIAKILATASTIGSGGSGGVVSPSLFIGAVLGVIMGVILGFDPRVMAIVGAVCLFSAIAHIPITGALMCGEIFSFQFVIPAIFVGVIGSWIASEDSIYRSTLISRRKPLKVAHKYRIIK
jgi:CIC family chloride channel protein